MKNDDKDNLINLEEEFLRQMKSDHLKGIIKFGSIIMLLLISLTLIFSLLAAIPDFK